MLSIQGTQWAVKLGRGGIGEIMSRIRFTPATSGARQGSRSKTCAQEEEGRDPESCRLETVSCFSAPQDGCSNLTWQRKPPHVSRMQRENLMFFSCCACPCMWQPQAKESKHGLVEFLGFRKDGVVGEASASISTRYVCVCARLRKMRDPCVFAPVSDMQVASRAEFRRRCSIGSLCSRCARRRRKGQT